MSAPYKLLSRRRTLLGVVTFPKHFEEALLRDCRLSGYAQVSFQVMSPEDRVTFSRPGAVYHHLPLMHLGCLSMQHEPAFGEACVTLMGITIAEFEQLPGCTFAPSMAYLETMLRGV